MNLDEAKEILKNKGYILEDTETNDEEYDALEKDLENNTDWIDNWSKKDKNKLYRMHRLKDTRNLKSKVLNSINFNVSGLFTGIEEGLKKEYKNVSSDLDYHNNHRTFFNFNNNNDSYNLEVIYNEDGTVSYKLKLNYYLIDYKYDVAIKKIDTTVEEILEFVKKNVE